MTRHLGIRAWATGTMLLAAVTACGGTSADSTPSFSPSVAASPSQSPSQAAASAASTATRRYFAALDSARSDKTIPLSRFSSTMVGIELAAERHLVASERRQHLHQVGATTIRALKVQSVDLHDSNPSGGAVPTVLVDVCWDVSKADLVNAKGQSVVSPTRRDRGWTRYTVANYQWTTDPTDGWRVANGHDLRRAPCARS